MGKDPDYRKAVSKAKREGWDWRYIRNVQDVNAVLKHDCWFDFASGDRVVQYFPKFLRLWKGKLAGRPFTLQGWQKDDFVMPIFGWKRPDGTRRFRQNYTEIPKKNGKSTLVSGVSLYMLTGDGEAGGENYTAANDEEQAKIVYGSSVKMAKASQPIRKRMKIRVSPTYMEWLPDYSLLKPLSRDVESKEGLDIHSLIYDEFHAVKDRRLWDTLKHGGASREQPLFIIITTAGENENDNSVWAEERVYAKKIISGEVLNPWYYALIYAANPEDDWTDPKVWKKANPSLGTTLKLEEMAAACDEAKQRPSLIPLFKRYRLNIACQTEDKWIDLSDWDACFEPFDVGDLLGKRCYCGLDLSNSVDITAFALVFPCENTYRLLTYLWVPGENIFKRADKDRVPYDLWQSQGWISGTSGNVIDSKAITAKILDCAKQFKIVELAFDPWRSVDVVTELQDAGITTVETRQGYKSFADPTAKFEEYILSRKLRHNGNPVLKWMLGNVQIATDPAGNMKPDKGKSREKIDGIVASIMALGRAIVNTKPKSSIYETRGVYAYQGGRQ